MILLRLQRLHGAQNVVGHVDGVGRSPPNLSYQSLRELGDGTDAPRQVSVLKGGQCIGSSVSRIQTQGNAASGKMPVQCSDDGTHQRPKPAEGMSSYV